MKNNINNYVSIIMLMIVSLTFTSCLEEEDDFGSDSSKVVPNIFDFNGDKIFFLEDTGTYSVTPRGGSEYVWTVNGAEMQPVAGRTDMINVFYNQSNELASVSVYEITADGKQSETSTIDGIKVFGTPCEWTIVMTDFYADSWNGATLSFTFDGFAADVVTNVNGVSPETATIAVPDGSLVDVTFNSGDWDGEITYKLYDASGTLVSEMVEGTYPGTGLVYSGLNTCP